MVLTRRGAKNFSPIASLGSGNLWEGSIARQSGPALIVTSVDRRSMNPEGRIFFSNLESRLSPGCAGALFNYARYPIGYTALCNASSISVLNGVVAHAFQARPSCLPAIRKVTVPRHACTACFCPAGLWCETCFVPTRGQRRRPAYWQPSRPNRYWLSVAACGSAGPTRSAGSPGKPRRLPTRIEASLEREQVSQEH